MTPNPKFLELVARAKKLADDSHARYHRLIREAHASGWSTRAIADAAGISHSRVYQIINDRQETK